MMRRKLAFIVLMALALLASGCEEYATHTPSAIELTMIAEQYDGADKEIVQATAMARYLAAEASRAEAEQAAAAASQAQATADAASAAAAHQLLMLTVEAQQTVDARNIQGTAQAWSATATADVIIFEAAATARAVEATATAQAAAIEATATAQALAIEATATERAWQATVTQEVANQQATATQQALELEGTRTAVAATQRIEATRESQQATASVAHATMTRQAEKREAVLGYGRDYGIPLVLLAIAGGIVALVVWGVREVKQRPVVCEPSVFGDGQQMRVPTEDGGFTFIDLDLLPGPAMRVGRDGRVEAPLLRDKGREERDKARDQAVSGMTRPRLGAGHGVQPIEMAPPARNRTMMPGLDGVVGIKELSEAAAQGMLPPGLAEAIRAQWQEVGDGDDSGA